MELSDLKEKFSQAETKELEIRRYL
ncbi:uncharacterized protein METZ01_LOCUS170250 [marine metagenome]|uniref:Uncharacterized protein n=1 Tax=marine metagenome TaxID=408172 RepID=A0A382BUA9_9ZZZZ